MDFLRRGWPVPKLGLVNLLLIRWNDPKATVWSRAIPTTPGLTLNPTKCTQLMYSSIYQMPVMCLSLCKTADIEKNRTQHPSSGSVL